MNKTTSSLTEQDFVRLPADRSLADAIVRPSVSYWRDVLRRIRSDKVAIVSLTFLVIIILMAVFAPILSPYGYETTDLLHTNQPPSAEHWFGTDAGGRDLWTRVWVGARISLIIGLGGAIVPQIIGIFLGGLLFGWLLMTRIGAVPLSLTVSGGVLIAGLFCGWLHARYPHVGNIPQPTLWFMNNVGLNTFIAIVGISTGPTFIQGFQEVGWSLFLIGAAATSIPLVAGIFIGRYLFRFNDALTLGCVAGARTTTAALGAVEETIQSNVPSMGYTITYAIGNTLLIIWGVVIVLLIA